ncbi:hypothetical protein KUCAC02_005611 [Chaenocephalus aceratus]|uniref:Uncharacterized protein n=1 Tax=Chaenocephalus aceratus TaxID=36190 RepID=A0ACB9WPN3_CHAAC|nr:hypothetical protein KUCAC02_005611 [Chaenocephalus aceratus]
MDRCPEGKYFSNDLCLECPSGHFCPGNVSAPQRCPAGTFNLYMGKSRISDCKPCFPGLISSEDRVDCRLCPAGFSCDPVNGTLSLCPPGQHSPEGVLQCLTCPVDSVCTSGFPIRCWPGKEPNVDHTVCNDCPPGLYSTICTIQCIQCPAGSYCPDSGMTQPLPCPPTWSSTHGQTECRSCNDTSLLCGGAVAPRWNQPVQRSSQTISCRSGTYKDLREELACVICPVGHYCVGGVAVPCPAGTYGPNEGLQRLRDCTICPAGFYCLEGSSWRPTSQFLCTQGYYCEEGTLTPNGSPCPAGTAGEQMGQTSRAACKRCREGRFCPAGSSGPGLPCARGRYCPAGTLEEVICPRGTFTPHQGAISVKDCLKCPAGFYCPEGRSNPAPCPPGSFNPLEGQDELDDCRECYAGKACTQVALKSPDVDCMQGFVCPPGSSQPNAPTNACPPGTLSDRTDLTDRSQCQQCLARYACLRGTGGIQRPPLFCFSGHYCPPGTMFPTQHKCPVGTWSGQSGLEAESECRPCPQGWYCLTGSAAPSGRCSSGHYCPEGTAYGTQFPCPAGTYSIHIGNRYREDCLICPEGSFCQKGTSKPSPCPISTFRHLKGGRRQDDCSACPAGYFCPHSATVNPRVCGAGSYSDEGSVECSPCLQGHYCSDETTSEEAMLSVMVCPPGFLCSQGLARDPQRSATLCPRGFFCPGGGIDPNPIPCTNGTYGESPGLRDASECAQCPEGEYCYSQEPQEQPITQPTGICPDGHYCPRGTGYPLTYPCQAGQYRNNTLGHSGEACVLCPSRNYCDRPGTHMPAVCPQGFYCPEGTSAAEPCPEGTYSSRSALSNGSECSSCAGGQYCTSVGLSEPSGSCKERFYCREGATSATPADGPTGGLCPVGSYCPPASSSPLPCPSGTFSNSTGLSRPEECVSCPPGFYCLGSNNTSPSGPCFPGFYCTGGSASPVQSEAEEGYYTLERAARQQPCPLGTYQPRRGAQSCVECQGGRLCNQTALSRPPMCPKGHFCPPGYSAARPCPPGSYSDQPGGDAVHHCRPCVAGWFCSRAGLSEPQGLCDSGHYCTSGASTASPVALLSGGVCSAGYICPRGTSYSQQHPCPVGTWSNTVGAQNMSSCWPCPSGLYCNNTGLSKPSGLYSLTGDICPIGHYCPMGSTSPLLCPDGTYFNSTGAEECDDCLSGTYCLSGEGVQPCPAGHYCFGGSVEGILPCPPGTYSPQFGLSQVEQCLICPAGFYCEDWGLFEPTGPCQAGYYCIAGVNFQNPDGNFSTGVGGTCPKGKYCPEGISLPLPCPPGTYSNSLHLTDVSGCNPCPAGVFCGTAGLTRPSGLCQAGFYCPGGDTKATGSEGGLCPQAHYCPEGSANSVPCPAGAYSILTGQSVCSRCPAGYYCPEKTGNFSKSPCPPGFYCPDGTRHATQFPCPRGYYNPEPMTQSLDSCLPCPPGHYCEKERLTKVSGKCKAGWFCVSAAWNSQPFDLDNYTNANCLCPATSTGGRCQAGFYCPLGSSEPVPCPPGTFCNISGLALPMGPCFPGYFCVGGATDAKPTDGGTGSVCPPGAYCVEGSGEPELCPAGTFSPVPGLTSEASCQPCTAGVYCREAGLRAPTGPCSQGYWCPSGQTVATALPCPPGHFCVQGSATPEPCPSGTYQDREKQATCTVCGAGYYCDLRLANASFLRPCPKGHYCPAGTSMPDQHPCPSGSFNPRVHTASLTACMPCTAGHFCPSVGLSEPAGPCNAGYWCREGASSPSPLDGRSGSLCPPGQYCPSGTTAPTACPEGSWSNSSGLHNQEDCKLCLGGFYCDSAGLTKPSGPCSGGFYCVKGAVTPNPTDGMTGGPCPEGSYCPEGTVQPLPCKPGTYVAVTHATECEPCVAGWYCVSGSLYLCPPGFYCPERTGFDSRGCPEGTYGPDPGYWSVSQCRQCDGGHYCSSRNGTAVTGQCQEGYYCSHGNTSPQPLLRAAEEGGPCPAGHYCPQAAINPLPCPRLLVPSGECWEGFFCLGGADRPDPPLIDSRGGPCPKGYYCSEGSVAPQQCPLGTISTEDSRAGCGACPQGFYCPGNNGSLSRTYECPVGHYCPSGTWSKHQYPCPAGSINPHTRMAQPQDCLLCPPGSFCLSPGKSVATGQCEAGYYCLSGAWSPTPEDGETTGDRCPEGHYCPQGSSAPVPCPIGRYSNTTRNRYLSDCLTCPPEGSLSLLIFVQRAITAQAKLTAASRPLYPAHLEICAHLDLVDRCLAYQEPTRIYLVREVLQFLWTGCSHWGLLFWPEEGPTGGRCSPGSYCPQGTSLMVPCPASTFSSIDGAVSIEATTVLKGVQSQAPVLQALSWEGLRLSLRPTVQLVTRGLTAPHGLRHLPTSSVPRGGSARQDQCLDISQAIAAHLAMCVHSVVLSRTYVALAHFNLYLDNTLVTAAHQSYGDVCPMGHICPQGSGLPIPCPAGSFLPEPGASSPTQCRRCPPGKYCVSPGSSQPTGLCFAGFFCSGDTESPTPRANSASLSCLCEILEDYTPKTDATFWIHNLSCFNNSRNSGSKAGWIEVVTPPQADSDSILSDSPPCLKSLHYACSTYRGDICPKGFYCPLGSAFPLPCEAGSYCNKTGLDVPTGPCAAGYYCPKGSLNPHASLCPPGHYCPPGTLLPLPCPVGTIQSSLGGSTVEACQQCPQGHYCHQRGTTEPSGWCAEGYYCPEGQSAERPQQNVCSVGHYCEKGSVKPTACLPGSYQLRQGQGSCKTCPAGSHCPDQGMTIPMPCERGFYCPSGSANQHACPAGTYGNKSGMVEEWQCSLCDPGVYCKGTDNLTGFPCPPGFFCFVRTSVPKPCPKGTFSTQSGLVDESQCRRCSPGFYCSETGLSAVSGACLPGHYCSEGSIVPSPCPSGSYQNEIGGKGKDYCKTCPLGSFQDVAGQKECNPCPPGFHCQSPSPSATRGSSTGVSSPLPCPAGYICPRESQPVPCPKGTYSPSHGLTSTGECLVCPAGQFCGSEGLIQPSGSCASGFLCLMGATVPNPTDNTTGSPCPPGTFCQQGLRAGDCWPGFYCDRGSSRADNAFCPAGFFCPSRTSVPIPCPAGTFSSEVANTHQNNCTPCTPGYYCQDAGSVQPALCPVGYYCPPGVTLGLEFPCPPGTVQSQIGASSPDACLPCPAGMFCSQPGLSQPTGFCEGGYFCPGESTSPNSTEYQGNSTRTHICPSGHYCPSGTGFPLPCPTGSLSIFRGLKAVDGCPPCPPGLFCMFALVAAPAPCHLTVPMATSALLAIAVLLALQSRCPPLERPQSAQLSSDKFPMNGPCPLGHYCPSGCLSPVPCPLGSIRNTIGGVSMESCSACPVGHYCSTEGLANPSGPCAAGFFCPFDFSSTTPYAFLCPKGHYCPEGSALALPCPTGEYQPNLGSDSCIPCRPGFYCEEAIVGEPWPCPPHSFCPAGTMVPQPCPNGTYTHSNQGGLQEERECLPCPSGRFCRAGRIQGVCAAGYLCVSGSADFTPQGPEDPNRSNMTQCQSGMQCAGPCPAGFFCREGTEEAELCPANTFRSSPGGASLQDCLPCPPQYWCQPGDPVLHPCPAGLYCDGLPGSDFNGGTGPRLCPLYTYRANPGAGSKGDCLACPPGSHCNSTGLTDSSNSPCPPGFWCSGSGPPILCPAGTKRALPGAAAPSQCELCSGGTFCPDPRATGKPNVEGISCRAAYQCPMGAVTERLCRAGSYCGPQTAEPEVCPEGYLCPQGSHSYQTPKQLCPFPYHCPANSSSMKSCDGGFMPVNTSGLRGSKNSCCTVCDEGTYRQYLSPIQKCLPCPAGYFCPSGTDNYKSNPCPLGYVCPTGSTQPIPCPAGSFGNLPLVKRMGNCQPCPAGTFNHLPAQKACFSCGSSSTSPAGSSSCTCIAKNRAFQHSDGSCLCRTGFIFYNELDFKSSTSDSEVRLADSRECVSPSLHSCNITCGQHGGNLDVEMGICQCERYVSAEELCNTSCLSRLPQLSAQFSPDGHLLLSLKERDKMVWTRTVMNVLGPDFHANNIGKIHLVQFDPEGVFGWIPTQRELINHFLSEPIEVLSTRPRQRRETKDDVFPRIPNPIACLSSDDMLIFHLTINHTDRRHSHFPVYQKDHLFNSNPSWDFGAFRRLQILMKQTNFNSTRFAHVFLETGKYVFVDSAVPEWSLVVVVSEEGTECDPRASAFQPMTPAQLVKHGIVKQHRLNLLPDWGVITGILSLLLVVVVVLTTTVLVLRPGKAKLVSQWRVKPKWRSLGEPFCPVDCVCSGDSIAAPSQGGYLGSRGVGEGAEAEEPAVSKGGSVSGFFDLEELNVKTLYDKLEDQNLHVASQLARHRKDTQEFYRNICQQTDTLKNVFDNMDHKKLNLLKELIVHNAMRDKPSNSMAGERDTQGSQEKLGRTRSCLLLHTVILLLMMPGSVSRKLDTHSLFSSMNMTKAEQAPCLSDHDLSKLVSISPLFKTLQEIQRSLHNLTTTGSDQHLHNDHCVVDAQNHDRPLVPTALDNLSPQHSAVFLFGCQVMQLLADCPLFPSVLLLLAKSIPSEFDASEERHGAFVEEFLNIRVPTEGLFTEHLLASRLQKYKYFKLEQLVTNLKRSSTDSTDTGLPPKGTPVQMSCIEEEIDRMTESFLQLSVQLQKRAQMSSWLKERERSAGNYSAKATPTSRSSLSRSGTILLELKRRYVSQRLNELQITLGHIRQSQQHDGKSTYVTRSRSQTDSITTQQQGKGDLYPGIEGCSPAGGQWKDSIPASEDHSQQKEKSRGLGNSKLEAHISDQQTIDSVQRHNPDTLLDCQMLESQDQLHLNESMR